MKLATKILSLLVLVVITIFYSGCGGDDKKKKTDAEKQLDQLKATWTLQSVTLDGANRMGDFLNPNNNDAPLVLTVTGTFAQDGTYNYSFTGTRPNPSPWPGSGTWKFGTSPLVDIIRDPGTTSETSLEYTLSGTSLVIEFNIPTGSTGWAGGTTRTKQVSGTWIFTFAK